MTGKDMDKSKVARFLAHGVYDVRACELLLHTCQA